MMASVTKRLFLGGLLALLAAAPSYGKAPAKVKATAHRPIKAKAPARTGPDSFLKYRVETVQEFLAAYDQDAVLRKRLAKHFHMPETQLTSYLHSELQDVAFSESRWVGTYGVKEKDGEIYPVKTYVRKGTKALGLADGTPLFKVPCGNPFQAVIPQIEAPRGPRPSSKPVEPLPSLPPVGPITLEPTALQSPEEYVLGQEIPRAPIFQVPIATEGRHLFPLWLPRDDGGGGETPEPASLLLLGAGATVLGLARRRRGR